MDEKTVEQSMQLILHSGTGRSSSRPSRISPKITIS